MDQSLENASQRNQQLHQLYFPTTQPLELEEGLWAAEDTIVTCLEDADEMEVVTASDQNFTSNDRYE